MALLKKKSPVETPDETPAEKLRPGEDFKHIAFIMDGNGRWAKKRGMPREYGHLVQIPAIQRLKLLAMTIMQYNRHQQNRRKIFC